MFSFVKNGAFIAILAHCLIGVSLVWDKVLLKNPGTKNLFSYVFWLGAMSVFGILLVPFGYRSPSGSVLSIAFIAGVLHLTGVFFYYAALKRGEASETLAVMGGLSPVATAAIGFALLTRQMSGTQLLGFALMSTGGFVMFLSEKLAWKRLLPPVLLASGLLGLVNVLEKVVYDQTNFVSGYVWFTIGTFAASLGLLIPSAWRKQIFSESGQDRPRNRFWYFVNRFLSGIGSFLVFYAISLAHPAIVDAISGVRYAVIFIGALLLTRLKPRWLKETFHGWQLITKTVATALVVAGLVLIGISGGNKGNTGSPTAGIPATAFPGPYSPRSAVFASARITSASHAENPGYGQVASEPVFCMKMSLILPADTLPWRSPSHGTKDHRKLGQMTSDKSPISLNTPTFKRPKENALWITDLNQLPCRSLVVAPSLGLERASHAVHGRADCY